MPKLEQCDRCVYCAHTYQIICALHPSGVEGENCPDFKPDPELEGKRFIDFLGINADSETEQWEPEWASYYNGELILQRSQLTPDEQLDLLDWHPIFTGRCPNCEVPLHFDCPPVHWDCSSCGWADDSIN